MVLPAISSITGMVGPGFFERLVGPSRGRRSGSTTSGPVLSLPKLKFELGKEPSTPRAGCPGFQDGHWVIVRPKLATPTIYQHGRSPANGSTSLGLGATSRPGSTRGSTRPTTPWSGRGEDCVGNVRAWDEDDDSLLVDTGRIGVGERPNRDSHLRSAEEKQPIVLNNNHQDVSWSAKQVSTNDATRVVDSPAIDQVEPYVDDLYFANAHPRFGADPVCLRRQRENAAVAAGALANSLAGVDRGTNQPPGPTNNVGRERAESLEHAARLLIRSLEGEFSCPLKARVAGALQKTLTFQDVRARVADVTPSAVAALVDLLRHKASSNAQEENIKEEEDACNSHTRAWSTDERQEWGGRDRSDREGLEERKECASTPYWQDKNKASLHAASCLRVMVLTDGLAEKMLSASAIPALVDGLRCGSAPMKNICASCLAITAALSEDVRLEMIDFDSMTPLLVLARAGDPFRELAAWSALAAVTVAPEARHAFIRAEGLMDLERILLMKQAEKADTSYYLLACQENAMRIIRSLCEDRPTDDLMPDETSASYTSSLVSWCFESNGGSDSGGCGRKSRIKRKNAEPELPLPCVDIGAFVATPRVFLGVLKQMKRGTSASRRQAAEVIRITWKACSRRQLDATVPSVLAMLSSDVWMLQSAAAQMIAHAYVEDEQRIACATAGGVEALVNMIRFKAQQMQAGTLVALLSLSEHPDVPSFVVDAGGVPVLADYLTTARDVPTRYVALTLLKIILVCNKAVVEPFLPDMLVSEHVIGASDDVEMFVEGFIRKRKATDYFHVGVKNLRRFGASQLSGCKASFIKLDEDASGELDEKELRKLLKILKVNTKRKCAQRVLAAVDKNRNGKVDFDEFLDIMWKVEHAKGARSVLFRRTEAFVEGSFAAAQVALKRMPTHSRQNQERTRYAAAPAWKGHLQSVNVGEDRQVGGDDGSASDGDTRDSNTKRIENKRNRARGAVMNGGREQTSS